MSVKAATTFAGRIAERYGEPCEIEGFPGARLFPTPQRLARAQLERLGIIRSRAQTVRDLARATLSGRLSFEGSQDADEFAMGLRAIRGIGDWTAQYVAMRVLKHPDAFPGSDLGLLRAFDGEGGRLKPAELLARAEGWRPWRAYAALLIWSSDDGAGG